jgi:hypothetical protein
MMRQVVPGPFRARKLGTGVWCLASAAAAGAEICLRGAGAETAELLEDANLGAVTAVAVEWVADGVRVALGTGPGARRLTARCAVVHLPLAHLYDALPLARFDDEAQRFWRRVFRLLRLPGGRFLLRLLTRGRRGARGAP